MVRQFLVEMLDACSGLAYNVCNMVIVKIVLKWSSRFDCVIENMTKEETKVTKVEAVDNGKDDNKDNDNKKDKDSKKVAFYLKP